MSKICLIIDDSRVVRQVARRIVTDLGLECAEAENGAKGLSHCEDSMPDVVILDWNMPVMSGLEFLEKLRQIAPEKPPKVILCTTENDENHLRRALSAGADEYIMKPFDSGILQEKLTQVGMIPA